MLCGGGFLAVCLSGPLMGLGRPGVLALAEGWVTVSSCTVVWGGWLPGAWCRRHACCWWAAAAVVVVVVGWLVGAPACLCACGGGMLSGFWGSAPWLPGLLSAACLWVVGCGCGWVGCELYSGREHLTVICDECVLS